MMENTKRLRVQFDVHDIISTVMYNMGKSKSMF